MLRKRRDCRLGIVVQLLVLYELTQRATPGFDIGGDLVELLGCRVELCQDFSRLLVELLIGSSSSESSES